MRPLPLVAAAFWLAACEPMIGTSPAPDYRPEEAGTIDHALCLLGFEAVPLREVSTGHHLVEAIVNGTAASFVLDTGANMTVVERSYADQFGLTPRSGAVGALGALQQGTARASQASLESLAVGPVPIRQDRLVLADMAQLLGALGQVAREEVVGVIGQDVLKEHRAVIDVARPMLYLMVEDRDPAPVPAERCGNEG